MLRLHCFKSFYQLHAWCLLNLYCVMKMKGRPPQSSNAIEGLPPLPRCSEGHRQLSIYIVGRTFPIRWVECCIIISNSIIPILVLFQISFKILKRHNVGLNIASFSLFLRRGNYVGLNLFLVQAIACKTSARAPPVLPLQCHRKILVLQKCLTNDCWPAYLIRKIQRIISIQYVVCELCACSCRI